MSSLPKMIQNKAFLSLLWILTMLCNFCLTALLQKPENISCIYYYNKTLTCSWTFGGETSSDTKYIIRRIGIENSVIDEPCEMKNGSCSAVNIPRHSYNIQIQIITPIRKVISNWTLLHLQEILKPGPPSIMKVEGMKEMLRVCWRRHLTMDPFMCQIHYQATTKNISAYINTQIAQYKNDECSNLTGLWNFTNYTVAVRCKLNESRFWSEWSHKATNKTEEQAPLKVDLWRVIEAVHPNGNRSVRLLWKECKDFPTSGIIAGYTVKYIAECNATFEKKYSQNVPVILSLTGEAYEISITAHNSAGDSPEATIRIPSIHEERMEHQRIATLKASALKEEMFLTWDPTDSEINGYIIEWYDELERDPYKRSWHRITNVTKWISPKGIFKVFRCYRFSVYPLHKDEIKMPSSTSIYFREGIPSIGPKAEVENPGKNDAIIKWEEIPKSARNGVIINYTIFYEAEGGKQLEESVDGGVLQYQLQSLQPHTRYRAQVRASTIVGGVLGKETYFVTKLFSITDIVLITIFIGIFMSCLLIVGLLCVLKCHVIKRICWPQIPHPIIACPAAAQKITLGNTPYEDINILKTDTCSENELPLLNPENCFKQASVTPEIKIAGQETFSSGEYKALECFFEASSLKDDFKNQTCSAEKRDSKSYIDEEMQHQKITLGNSPSEEDINIMKTGTCNENELPLLNPEKCFKQASITPKMMVAVQEAFGSTEYKALERFFPVSFLKDDFKNQTIPAVKRDSKSYVDEKMQHQVNLRERTEFNPYLKNSVCTREFLDCEKVEQNSKETDTQPAPLAFSLPNSAGYPYVAPDAVKLFSKH